MSWISRVGWLAAAVTAVVCIAAAPAHAADWPMPAGSAVSLPYGATWVDAVGRRCTHGGVDIPAADGDIVRSCVAGRVLFSGEVPSAAGGRVRAVTIATSDGLSVSFMPLSCASVASGSELAAGTSIGTLSVSGDGSSPGAHLHLSVRRGETPLDPERFLARAGVEPALAAAAPAPGADVVSGSGSVPGAATTLPLPGRAVVIAPRTAVVPAELGADAAGAPLAAATPTPRRVVAPLLRMDGRAIHTLPGGSVHLPRLGFRAPDVAAFPGRTVTTRLVIALAAAGAMWCCAARAGSLHVESAAEGRR